MQTSERTCKGCAKPFTPPPSTPRGRICRSCGHRRTRYGLAPGEYERMLEAQGYGCAICRSPLDLHVDHCHTTGKVRGLLCLNCNKGIGHFHDDAARLVAASEYITRTQERVGQTLWVAVDEAQ